MMEEILQEQGFQQSGCTSNECIVEVGRLIGVEKIVGGSISKVGNLYSVSARIVSVETGEVLKAVSYDHGGKLSDLLKTGMKDVALELVGQKRVKVPSVAIIPLNNKGEKVDDFYAWGISADLISDVSGAGLIRVASLRQIEELGDIPIEEIARKLFVRYIATGTLWKIENVFQLSLELYDTKESKVIWSDRWQEEWKNLPSIKGKLAENILNTLNVTTKQVITKAHTANSEAYEFYLKGKYRYEKRENMEDTEIARGLFRKAIELDDNLIAAKNYLGSTYFGTGDYDSAMEIYDKALQQAKELGEKKEIANLLQVISEVYLMKNENDKAMEYTQESLAICEEIGNKLGIAKSLMVIGMINEMEFHYDKAMEYYKRAMGASEEIGDKGYIANSLNGIGGVYLLKQDYEKSLEYFKQGLTISEEIQNKRQISYALFTLGNLYFDQGDNNQALDYYKRSVEKAESIEYKQGMIYALDKIAYIYEDKGDYEKALNYHTRSLEIKEEIGDKRRKGSSLYYIGRLYSMKGDYDNALDYYTRALEIQEELGDKLGMGHSLNGIGDIYRNKGDYDKALDYYTRSLEIIDDLGDKY
jgi:tetratricopeptide (TPR) repeat protein